MPRPRSTRARPLTILTPPPDFTSNVDRPRNRTRCGNLECSRGFSAFRAEVPLEFPPKHREVTLPAATVKTPGTCGTDSDRVTRSPKCLTSLRGQGTDLLAASSPSGVPRLTEFMWVPAREFL
jgi:hypothetical protein